MNTDLYQNLQKRDATFTLQNAAVRNTFLVLRGFAIPHTPFGAFPPYFTFQPPGSPPAVFSWFARRCAGTRRRRRRRKPEIGRKKWRARSAWDALRSSLSAALIAQRRARITRAPVRLISTGPQDGGFSLRETVPGGVQTALFNTGPVHPPTVMAPCGLLRLRS
jgi:hypothetical protein